VELNIEIRSGQISVINGAVSIKAAILKSLNMQINK